MKYLLAEQFQGCQDMRKWLFLKKVSEIYWGCIKKWDEIARKGQFELSVFIFQHDHIQLDLDLLKATEERLRI